MTAAKERLIQALGDLVVMDGYSTIRVPRVCAAAKVSHRSFYEEFLNKQDAFTQLLVERSLVVLERVHRAAAGVGNRWPHRTIVILRELCDALDQDRELARLVLMELPTAGGHALNDYERYLSHSIRQRRLQLTASASPQLELLAVGMITWIFRRQLSAGARFSEQLPELLDLVVTSSRVSSERRSGAGLS